MKRVFSQLLYESEHGTDTMLVTIVRDSGSAPRGAGAGMLVGPNGRITGTIGGGAVEYQSESIAAALLRDKRGGVREFALRPEGKNALGMACGGDVTVLFSFVPANDPDWCSLAAAVTAPAASGPEAQLVLPLDGTAGALFENGRRLAGASLDGADVLPAAAGICGMLYAAPLARRERVVIFGGGHIAQALVPLLPAVDFRAVVFDDRPAYADPALFPAAENVICGDFDHIADSLALSPEDYIVVMTSGHEHDLTVEEQALRVSPAYLGVIGSRKKIVQAREALTARGFTAETLDRVHSPIGLSIRAVTPAEIAVSILAELILSRAEARGAMPASGCPMHTGNA